MAKVEKQHFARTPHAVRFCKTFAIGMTCNARHPVAERFLASAPTLKEE